MTTTSSSRNQAACEQSDGFQERVEVDDPAQISGREADVTDQQAEPGGVGEAGPSPLPA